ncbi:SMI1/KNR4 family protein [Flavihumibacter sp. CACIAM 22H1]|uniref:SMI1/KNR4 family protein n=1 Tax=Flavihumibacter sp. CACIAM 22H1 TaxID=1812911 RepID=UPI0007A90D15|nr:SMI1/KNR4 family protein [Flavihumibacter sp. CACIAM 22H1]KYP13816.1 MAG: hypothetical protein A1D16_11410 [Flavihumibacter sp. CACIAM 22H1]
MHYFEKAKKIIEKYRTLGEQKLNDGTVLIGKAPHVAPHAWLNKLFPVLNLSQIKSIEQTIGAKIPEDYRDFLLNYSNGLKVFIDTLSLDGLRLKSGRTLESAWQPYSIFTPNVEERIEGALSQHFFIGGYSWDGSLLYIDRTTNKVHRCNKNSIKPLNSWNNFQDMLIMELERLDLLFDDNGVEKDKNKPTTP